MYSDMNRIYRRHVDALEAISHGSVSVDAAKLALALAMRDLVDALPQTTPEPDREADGVVMALTAKLNEVTIHLNKLSAEHDDQHEELEATRRELETLIAERDGLRLYRSRADLRITELEAQLAAIHGNGKTPPAAVLVQAFDADQPSTDYTGLDWSSLSPQAQDYRIGLDAGRWKWRDIPRTVRLDLVRCVIRNAGEQPTQAQFDAIRPGWMATATAQCAAFGVLWGILANPQHEIEVQP